MIRDKVMSRIADQIKHMMKTDFRKTPQPVAARRGSRPDWTLEAGRSPFGESGSVEMRRPREETQVGAMPVWKRCLDLFCILLSLPVLLPVVALVILWIKLGSHGPVLFSQDRVGRGGRRFLLFKFRSMQKSASTDRHEDHFQELVEADRPMVKLDTLGDQRLIAGGSLLRTLGLDELPQLINVVRGDMSIVGPRPCLPKEYNLYEPAQRERFDAVPGLTGFWQVNGKNRTKFSEMVDMDIYYSRNISLGLDLKIMFQTVPAIYDQAVDSYASKRRVVAESGSPEDAERALSTTQAEETVN